MSLYPNLVWVHMLLLVLWLGGDLGVFILGQHFRRRSYSLPERLTILRLLVITDLGPRFAWALMVPVSMSLLHAGGWWPALPFGVVLLAWGIGLGWSWLVWDAHAHDMTPRAGRNRRVEGWLRVALAGFYLGLGGVSLVAGAPLEEDWLAAKALLFGLIFVAAIMIDRRFKPVGPLLMALIEKGSSDATEVPLRATMDATRRWVLLVYALLVTSWLGSVKPF
ncbi:hypothetical protein FHS79_002711 [Polymorphobacter multimanifer]|uniref:Copper resistance protein D domain-containing protein n=1 Tax=Polymorphobacter multimanifer TaxID=1070431 RepID=A0A841LA51_9SPHN|nr:hypothetical protein [Polymorphobacter multimanifer]MBB6228521.1 hypothetical protein [Polymorphobacter multimanifer]